MSSSNDPNLDDFSTKQIERFEEVCKILEDSLAIHIPSHIMNSNGAIRFGVDSKEWIRLGIALYGGLGHPNLKQIFSLKVLSVKQDLLKKVRALGIKFICSR